MKSSSMFLPSVLAYQPTRANQAWVIDFMALDFTDRPAVMVVADVGTRRPISATVSLVVVEDIIATLDRLVQRAGIPEQLWMDHNLAYNSAQDGLHPALRAWAARHRILLTHIATLQKRYVAESLLRDLRKFLHGKRFQTLIEVGHEIEHWRRSSQTGTPTIPHQ